VRVSVAGAPPGAEAAVSVTGEQLEMVAPWRGRLDPALAGQEGGPAWAPANDAFLSGPGRFTPNPGLPEGVVVEVPVAFARGLPAGARVPARAQVEAGGETASAEAELVVREPGWRMVMVPHFHYDPVWWNTQAGYTSGWDELLWAQERREPFQHSGIACVEAHLERARVDPAYKFVLAEVDYLKPFWDLYPDRRAELRALLAAGRLEIVGGTYNEANTNLTGAETAIRVAVYGFGFQRDVVGAMPESAWQLDVFGHDPQFPGIMADCGASCSAWARGPFHQWGPRKEVGPNSWMQFPSEFEWIAPNGRGLLTSYMPNHYSAGWELEMASSLEGAMWTAYEIFSDLAEVSATRATMLPVGTDYTPPGRYTTDVAAAWSKRYTWPRFEVGLPAEFFAAVRAELAQSGRRAWPQTRDMGPIYTGKDVSYIDTKQAQRLAEATLADAEAMAAVASILGAPVPYRELDKAWRQLVFGAHHDGITGSESDQVYLDLLGGWREAYELARRAEGRSRSYLLSFVAGGDGESVVVTNTLGFERCDLVSLELPAGAEVEDPAGEPVALLCETPSEAAGDVRKVTFLACSVPGIGYKSFKLNRGRSSHGGWRAAEGTSISNEYFEVTVDPARGGGVVSLADRASGFELIPAGEVANELLLYPEYPGHPRFGEGPWHLLPKGPPARSGSRPASVRVERCELGERLVVEGSLGFGPPFSYRQAITLWKGLRRAELSTEVHGWAGRDELLRLRFPTCLGGATPVCAVGDATVGRGFAMIDVDAAEHPWTLDNPCAEWFGLSTTLVVEARDGGAFHERSVSKTPSPTSKEGPLGDLQRGRGSERLGGTNVMITMAPSSRPSRCPMRSTRQQRLPSTG
jgi:alpha-mannosidase